jgi:imidazoleglycerol-phosphate dehydratase
MGERRSVINRKTKETDINCELNLDGKGQGEVNTGIGFFDHMLLSFAKHGFFDLKLSCKGDLNVDCHHTIEDVGIVLGIALKKALGDKKGITRYGSVILPMDDALVMCAVDFCGRPYLGFEGSFSMDRVGYFDTEMVREFFYAVSYSAGMNIHIRQIAGDNTHHIIEAMFKSFARAVDAAAAKDPRISDVLSTKGSI